MSRRIAHGEDRHAQGDRPTSHAFQDREHPHEIYVDLETGYQVYIGANGRTHVFTPDGRHHTSFYTSKRGRQGRVRQGRWARSR